ncbi:aminopeptidase N-like [Rhopalosiphum maidis]|uniref:aminopeptidase N-like n=1 Tax=Rhopalosiphum maidis TaxID=43146 RepID=UPI000F008B44|nr:aminopeptidase N-like [Rhopalosiphum maidis]
MFKLAGILSAALLCALVRGQGDPVAEKMDVFRLPENTSPVSYDLWFAPNLSDWTVTGVSKITVKVENNIQSITLNLKDLNVTDVSAMDITRSDFIRSIIVKDKVELTKNEQFEIQFDNTVFKNRILLLTIKYKAQIRDDMTGLYKSSYIEDGVTKWLAVTQFEPTYARRAFPCFDEPKYKVPFNISVVVQKNLTALSNMPILKTEIGPDNNTVYFSETPPMSTYLAAIYVGEFVPDKNNSKITVYTHKGMKEQTEYIATEAPKHLKVLEEYTAIDYMLPKMDLLAIPDFKAGAMENWGLNTYRESCLLLSNDSKTKMKIRASEVVQHEFTHQWFGNLVTCKWWDYLWLNEGFARYFQYLATGMVRTSWSMEELFVVEAFQSSLAYDQTPRHPITASVNTPEEIENVFDTISYSKAASVLRMLKYLVTEDLFKLSLQRYLIDFSQNAAEPVDLFTSFDNVLADHEYEIANGLLVNEFMSNWTLQSGYPVLNITRNATSNKFLVTQSQFYVNKTSGIINETAAWHIGLTYTTNSSKNFSYVQPSVWTNKTSASTVIPAPRDIDWYIFNIQSIGLYRVNYDVDNWMALIKQLNQMPNDIHVLNRAQLIDDAFNLARSGQLDYSVALHLSKYLKNENNTTPWYSAMNGFAYLLERMPRSDNGYADFKSHVSSLAGNIYSMLENLVSNNNTEYKVLSAWETFSKWACGLENKYCTKKAQEYFNKWQAGEKIPADIKDAAFCVGVKNSNGSLVFNNMFTLYRNTKSISEKSSAGFALGCSTNRTQLSEFINHILDGPEGPIKENDIKSVVSSISTTPLGLDVLYEFLSTNINKTLDQLSSGEEIVTYIYSILASKITNNTEIEKIKNLKNNSTLRNSIKSSFEESYKKVDHNLAWFDSYSVGINQWSVQYGEKEKEEKETSTSKPTTFAPAGTTISPVTGQQSTTTSKPSSATSNTYSSLVILQLTVLTILIKTLIL